MAKYVGVQEQAAKFGRHDMERLGLFIEMPYMNGKGYVSPFPKPKPDKGRNIMGEGRKSKNGTMHGYFDDEFRRLFKGEGLPRKRKGKYVAKGNNISTFPFMPAGSPKWHASPGDYFGCFSGVIEAFGTGRRKKRPYVKQKPNFYTNPGKLGGTGYANICLSKYPEHLRDPYRPKMKYKTYGKNIGRAIVTVHFPQPYFENNPFHEEKHGRVYIAPKEKAVAAVGGKWVPPGPAKWQGGCHAGMFTPFPAFITNRNPNQERKEMRLKAEMKKKMDAQPKMGPPSMALKTMLTSPVMPHNLKLSMNIQNYKTYEPVYTTRLLPKADY